MQNSLIEQYTNISTIVTTANYYIRSDEGRCMLPERRDELIDHVTGMMWAYKSEDITTHQIKDLVTELVSRIETDDNGWYIDTDDTRRDMVIFKHPDRPATDFKVLLKTPSLLPFDLTA